MRKLTIYAIGMATCAMTYRFAWYDEGSKNATFTLS